MGRQLEIVGSIYDNYGTSFWNIQIRHIHAVCKSSVRCVPHVQCYPSGLPKCYICNYEDHQVWSSVCTGIFFAVLGTWAYKCDQNHDFLDPYLPTLSCASQKDTDDVRVVIYLHSTLTNIVIIEVPLNRKYKWP